MVPAVGAVWVGTRVGYTRWVPGGCTGEGYTRYYPAPLKAGSPDSVAGPVGPAGAGVGGQGWERPPLLPDHPCGARSLRSLSGAAPRANAASGPIVARFDLIS